MIKVIYNVFVSEDCPSWLSQIANEVVKMKGYSFSTDKDIDLFSERCNSFLIEKNPNKGGVYLSHSNRGIDGNISIHSKNVWNNDWIRISYIGIQGDVSISACDFKLYQHPYLPYM